jgi:hypothetical protein
MHVSRKPPTSSLLGTDVLKSEIKSVSINLNFIEQSIYSFESHPNTFSFLRVDMTIMNSDIRESTIQNASQELVSLYPELTSMYTEMDD